MFKPKVKAGDMIKFKDWLENIELAIVHNVTPTYVFVRLRNNPVIHGTVEIHKILKVISREKHPEYFI